ncbi:MAG: DUF3592 domain-containing protein [Asticcacaulis sp.]
MSLNKTFGRWLIGGMVIAQCAFLWFGVGLINERRSFLEGAVRSQAEVISAWEVKRTGRRSTVRHALIAFETADGRLVNAAYKTQFEFLALKDRQALEVAYLPDDPQAALPADFWRLWFEPLLAIGFAGFFLVLGLLLLWPARKVSAADIVT